jgi:hypothetical protein
VAETTNGSPAQVINPGGGFAFPTSWTPVTDSSIWGLATQDFAFRLEGDVGVVGPSAVTVTFDVTVTARPGEVVTNAVTLDDGATVIEETQTFQVPAPRDYTWEKDVIVNGAAYGGEPIEVGDEIQVVDRVLIDYEGWAASVLTETWDGSLELIDLDSNGGTVVPAPGALVWEGMGSDSAWLVLTKTFGVRDVSGRKKIITETLTVESFAPEVRTLDFSWKDHHLYLPVVIKRP